MVHYYRSEDGIGAYAEGDLLCDTTTGHVSRAVSDGRGIVLVPAEDVSICDSCGEIVADIDAGFSPAVHGMAHECGGRWRRPATGDEIRPLRATSPTQNP